MRDPRTLYPLDLILVLTHKELKARYQSSFLGYLWSVAHPLSLAGALYLAFKLILDVPIRDYPLFVVTGLFCWQWFQNSLISSSGIYLRNATLIKRVRFSNNCLPLAVVLHDMLHFLLSIPILAVFLTVYGRPVPAALLYGAPVLLALQALFLHGLCLAVASLTLFFRDLERLVLVALMLAFYCTPISYSELLVGPSYRWMFYANPLAVHVIGWRTLLLDGTLSGPVVLSAAAYAGMALAAGHWIYGRLSHKFAEVV